MIEADRLITGDAATEEQQHDRALRPKLLADYIGQQVVRSQMEVFIAAARNRQEALDHSLIFGHLALAKRHWRTLLPMN